MEVAEDTSATFTFSTAQVDKAEAEAARDADADSRTSDEEAAADDLLDYSDGEGTGTADAEAVEVVSLAGGEVLIAKTPATELAEVEVVVEDGAVSVTAGTDPGTAVVQSSGPGMAGSWGTIATGDYTLKVGKLGDANFSWKRRRWNDPNSPFYLYWYKRFGDGDPNPDYPGPQPKVKLLRVQSFPFDNTAESAEASWPDDRRRLATWLERDPGTDFEGDCNSSPIRPEIDVPGGVVGFEFKDCDQYHVWRNAEKPGSYWIEMNQGFWVTNGGSKQAGFVMSWQARKKHPTTGAKLLSGSLHDLNKVVFTIPGSEGDTRTCTQTDASRDC
ncbi:MAG: hypothetical protein NTX33_03565 [Propionibacteriales bacterium]|nr:hypothetical protein [Propionibacteriales bacterium]